MEQHVDTHHNAMTPLINCCVAVNQVWDIRRLERDVSFASRLTYAGQSGRIMGLCPVLDGSSVASGSSSGSLHVWHVDYSSKPGGWAPDKYRGQSRHLLSATLLSSMHILLHVSYVCVQRPPCLSCI